MKSVVSKNVTIRFAVPLEHLPGDYALLYSNNGDGPVSFARPHHATRYELFPNGVGNYGFGMAPFGMSPFGQPWGRGLPRGFGELPFGMSPFGVGAVLIEEVVPVADCGDWAFAFKTFDRAGNPCQGVPAEAVVSIHVAPPTPLGLRLVDYDPVEQELTLAVVNPFDRGLAGLFPNRLATGGVGDTASGGARGIGLPGADGTMGGSPDLPDRLIDPDLGEEEEEDED